MITLYEPAYAKLNLTLDVLGKRADGYHDLKSVMQTVSVQDDIQIDIGTGKPWELSCSDPEIPTDGRNHAWKAAKVFFDTAGIDPEGIKITITKRIPSQAGMGGGSADAAAVLRTLNRHFGTPFSDVTLAELGAQVGSDVPFCVLGGTMMAEGRGELLRKLPNMPDCIFVICKPDFSASTPELYRKLDGSDIARHPDNLAMENALQTGDLGMVAGNVFNVFDPLVSAEHPEVDHIKSVCDCCGSLVQQMTGSGSAVFAIMPDLESAELAYSMLKKTYLQVFIAKPV